MRSILHRYNCFVAHKISLIPWMFPDLSQDGFFHCSLPQEWNYSEIPLNPFLPSKWHPFWTTLIIPGSLAGLFGLTFLVWKLLLNLEIEKWDLVSFFCRQNLLTPSNFLPIFKNLIDFLRLVTLEFPWSVFN